VNASHIKGVPMGDMKILTGAPGARLKRV